jgi:hypothetical protein
MTTNGNSTIQGKIITMEEYADKLTRIMKMPVIRDQHLDGIGHNNSILV